ncbi:MAG: transglycosylase domain-containing protein [Brevibacterium yomogidense]
MTPPETPRHAGSQGRHHSGSPVAKAGAKASAGAAATASGAKGASSRFSRWVGYPRPGRTGWRRWIPALRHWAVALLLFVALGLGAFGIGYAVTDIPEPNVEAAGQTSTVYYQDGETEVGSFSAEDRTNVSIDEISPAMRQAAIAAEDQSFYENRGISFRGLTRAVWGVVTDDYAGGGSTITQQYVKNFYLTNERSIDRKVKEMFISLKIDQELSKDEVLANYLNTIYLGRQSYGIEVAANNYFDKPASELDVAESALLAAMIQRPGAADPAEEPEQYEDRFRYVLDGMVKLDYLTEEEAAATEMPDVGENPKDNQYKGQNGYLLSTVMNELKSVGYTEDELNRGGYDIVSTFDEGAMDAAVDAVEKLPELNDGMHVGLSSVDPATGGVVAIYGGEDYLERAQNTATQDTAQAGSTFKVFTLVAGLENGFRLTDYFSGTSGTTFNYDGTPWTVRNYGGSTYGSVSLLRATQSSINTAYAQLNIEVGPEKTMDVAQRAGFPDDTVGLEPNAANVLGTASPTVTQMAGAFSTFAAEGVHHQVHFVDSVTDPEGEVVHEAEAKGDQAIDQAVAAETSYALSNVVTGGSGSYANNLGRPAAGKTGTSQNAYSAWFAGYTPNLSTAVSIFREDGNGNPVEIGPYGGRGEITGGSFPTMVWTDYMIGAVDAMDLPVEQFPERGELPQVEKPANDSGVPDQAPAPAPQPQQPQQPQNPGGNGGGGDGDSSEEDSGDDAREEEPEEPEEEPEEPEEDEGDDGGEEGGIAPPDSDGGSDSGSDNGSDSGSGSDNGSGSGSDNGSGSDSGSGSD